MAIKHIIDILNPLKWSWWNQNEWIMQKNYTVHEIVEENAPCSWDVEIYSVVHYKHKKTCEERVRVDKDPVVQKTVFEHPEEKLETIDINKVDTYEGPRYE